MSEPFAPATAEAAFDHDTTLVVALELSGKSWEAGAVVPGVTRRPRRRLQPRDMPGLLSQLDKWRAEALKAGLPSPKRLRAGRPDRTAHRPHL